MTIPNTRTQAEMRVEIAEGAVQAAENGDRREAGGRVALLDGEISTEFTERLGKRTTGTLQTVPGDKSALTRAADEFKREAHALRAREVEEGELTQEPLDGLRFEFAT